MNISKKLNLNNINQYIIIFIVAMLYFVVGKISFMMSNEHQIVTIVIFASEGIALASALYFGKKIISGIFFGQFILAYSSGMNFFPAIEISFLNSIEAMIGIYLFNRYKLNKELLTLRDILGLFGIIVFALQPFSAIIGNIILLANSIITFDLYFKSLFSWWFGNVMGQLLFTPFVLILLTSYKKIKFIEYLIYSSVFAFIIYMVEIVLLVNNLSLLFSLTMPIIIFIVYYKGLSYGTLFTIILSIISLYSVYLNIGVFSIGTVIDNVININFFILAHITIVLMIGILFQERKENEINLYKIIEKEIGKNKEQQLLMLQQSRLAQMGEMISMIAHQWRQPLNILAMLSQTIILKYHRDKLNDKAIEYFKKNSNKQIQNMSQTINDFRDFFKPEKERVEFILNDIIKNTIDMVMPVFIEKQIDIIFDINNKFMILGFPNELSQTILNIVNNAKDALIENEIKDKQIIISLKMDSENIILTISDNAGGIPLNIIDKIFDPYFSTKEEKNGTGLGLYMTKIIIEEHMEGKITVSNDENGAVFTITLKKKEYR